MPKAPSTSTKHKSKAATKAKVAGEEKENKPKRNPTAYNIFVSAQIALYKEHNTGCAHKEAFKHATTLWADADENPKRGQTSTKRKKHNADGLPASSSQPTSAEPSSDI